MARKLQVFTRLYPEKIDLLDTIGQEMIDTGQGRAADLINPKGFINQSEVIRRLLEKADRRFRE